MRVRRRAKKRTKIAVFLLVMSIIVIISVVLKVAYVYLEMQYRIMSYPLKFTELVEFNANEQNLDKYLIYAVINEESSFRANAESNVGARGLMQIMEDTFDWIKFRKSDSEAKFSDMYEPDKNIEYGAYYIRYLLNYFYGDLQLALCAYHAGPSSVDSWLANPEFSKDGIKLDKIPEAASDTAHYVDKVNKAYNTYIKTYANKEE
ncbi:MAG: lytic transglycosylase domain-containing protein [Oscillospiraceae bacterium]|nr:lytic transglycosylase domain-containing protein [Oscillospiraceae bacterium]